MTRLTPRQRLVLQWVKRYARRRGRWPTMRETMEAFGMQSTNGAASTFRALEKKGFMKRGRGRYDSWELTGYRFILVEI